MIEPCEAFFVKSSSLIFCYRSYRHLSDVHLRYARWDLSRVDLVDPHSGAILCPVRPIDKAANAEALRRVLEPVSAATAPQATGIAPLLKQMIAEYAATGLPPPPQLPLTG